ncbi:glycosyltransferase [Sphingobacterium thalpophilum]|uniref:glycosyltransferase n=1 Tax=Sphingobacterium thalpophilum TaxID=259 RepID=UPI003DA1FD27
MNILHVIGTLEVGGAENLLIDLVKGLNDKGHLADVLVLKDSDGLEKKLLSSSTNQAKVFKLTKGSIYNPLLIFSIIPFLKNYDIVHVHLFPSIYWVVIAKLLSFSSVKLVYTEHSTRNRRREKWYFKFLDRFIYSFINLVICITDGTYRSLRDHLNRDFNYEVIHNGIDLNKFRNASSGNEQYFRDKFKLIQIANFKPAKDQMTVLKALKSLREEICLLLVGDGELRATLEDFVAENKLENRVLFLGIRLDIPELLLLSDVVVQSSYYEGFGLAAVEGMASRKPVLASDVSGLNEVVRDYGLLFEQGNSNELAKLIEELYSNSEYYDLVKERCFARSKDYSIELMINKYIICYEKS